MTPLAQQADQAVRHAVDAYIDGRLLPTFEGEASFETRNSTYRVLDGVLFTAPDRGLVGAELVGWLVEFVSRAEVSQTWRAGARAVLVDTRNDGVRGPHIVVTSATRAFRKERVPSAPSLPAAVSRNVGDCVPPVAVARVTPFPPPPAPVLPSRVTPFPPAPVAGPRVTPFPPPPAMTGSRVTQDGHPGSHAWGHEAAVPAELPPPRLPPPPPAPGPFPYIEASRPATLPPPPPMAPVPRLRPYTIPPPAMVMKPATLPPPPPPRPLPRVQAPQPAVYDDGFVARRIAATVDAADTAADDLDDLAPTARDQRQSSRTSSRLSHGASIAGWRGYATPPPPASTPFLLSRSHQRGVPLR